MAPIEHALNALLARLTQRNLGPFGSPFKILQNQKMITKMTWKYDITTPLTAAEAVGLTWVRFQLRLGRPSRWSIMSRLWQEREVWRASRRQDGGHLCCGLPQTQHVILQPVRTPLLGCVGNLRRPSSVEADAMLPNPSSSTSLSCNLAVSVQFASMPASLEWKTQPG